GGRGGGRGRGGLGGGGGRQRDTPTQKGRRRPERPSVPFLAEVSFFARFREGHGGGTVGGTLASRRRPSPPGRTSNSEPAPAEGKGRLRDGPASVPPHRPPRQALTLPSPVP